MTLRQHDILLIVAASFTGAAWVWWLVGVKPIAILSGIMALFVVALGLLASFHALIFRGDDE